MSIQVAESAGFCFGVNRAVELVEKAAKENKRVFTLGPIIHNTMRWPISRKWGFMCWISRNRPAREIR